MATPEGEKNEPAKYVDTEESSPGGGYTKLKNKALCLSTKNARPLTTTAPQSNANTGMGLYMKTVN